MDRTRDRRTSRRGPSVVAGAVAGLLADALKAPTPATAAVGATAGVVSLVVLGLGETRAFLREVERIPVAFPEPPPGPAGARAR
jgi:hypothetical protein